MMNGDTASIQKFIPNEDRIGLEDTLLWMLTGKTKYV